MIRKLGLFLLSTTSFFCTPLCATTQDVFRLGSGVEYVLLINDPQVITNPFLWTIKAVCTIISKEETDNFLSFKVLRKSGSLNGTKLSLGDSMTIHLLQNEKMYINALPGAQVELLNIGDETITANCTIA